MQESMRPMRQSFLYASLLLGSASLVLHALPFLLYSRNPLGYDTGFYRRYLIEPFQSIPNPPVPGLGDDALVPRVILDLLRLTHLQTDFILYGSYALCFALLPIIIYYFLRPTLGQRGALIAGFLVIASSVSYQAYWHMLFKNAFALDLLLLAFIALERRKWPIAGVLDVVIALSHTTSAIIYLATLGILFLIWPGRRLEMAAHGIITALIFALVNTSHVHHIALAMPTALFIEWPQYIILSLPFFLLLSCGWKVFYTQTIPRPLIAFTIVSFAFPLFHLPFYERIFIFSDIALAALAAYAAHYLLSHIHIKEITSSMYLFASVLCVSFGLLLGNLYNQVDSLRPLISESSIQKIQSLDTLVPSHALILTSANEAPWYEGWTHAHIAAPGLLHDRHNFEKWEALWAATSSADQIAFLASYPQPLYISTLESFNHIIGAPAACLQPITPYLLYNACESATNAE